MTALGACQVFIGGVIPHLSTTADYPEVVLMYTIAQLWLFTPALTPPTSSHALPHYSYRPKQFVLDPLSSMAGFTFEQVHQLIYW